MTQDCAFCDHAEARCRSQPLLLCCSCMVPQPLPRVLTFRSKYLLFSPYLAQTLTDLQCRTAHHEGEISKQRGERWGVGFVAAAVLPATPQAG